MKKNTNKKATNYTYVVDITRCEDIDDTKLAFIFAKADHAIITTEELDFLIAHTTIMSTEAEKIVQQFADSIVNCISCVCEKCQKKLPWYKRAWNKLKYAFTW